MKDLRSAFYWTGVCDRSKAEGPRRSFLLRLDDSASLTPPCFTSNSQRSFLYNLIRSEFINSPLRPRHISGRLNHCPFATPGFMRGLPKTCPNPFFLRANAGAQLVCTTRFDYTVFVGYFEGSSLLPCLLLRHSFVRNLLIPFTSVSCVECRRRKIKCDRNEPCTQCIQSKNSTCRYKDGNSYPAAPKTAEAKSSAKSSASPLSSDQLGAHGFVHFDPEVLSSDHDGRLSRSVSMIAPVFGESHSNSTTLYTPSADSPEEPKPDQSVQILSERLSKLEKNLTTVSSRNSDPLWTSFSSLDKPGFFGQATTVPVPELRGSVSKTRLYGQSHWMSAFVQVSHYFYTLISYAHVFCSSRKFQTSEAIQI